MGSCEFHRQELAEEALRWVAVLQIYTKQLCMKILILRI